MSIDKASLESRLNMSLDDLVKQNSKKKRNGGPFPKEKKFSPKSNGSPYTRPNKSAVSNRVYVGNLAWETSWQSLKDHFKQVGDVVYADVFINEEGRSKGCGIVEFENRNIALKAIQQLTDSELDGRYIFVREDREVDNNQRGGNTQRRRQF